MVHTFQIDKAWQEQLSIATFDNDSLPVGNYRGKKNPHKNRTVELKEFQRLFLLRIFQRDYQTPSMS